tara:strand:+ start:1613 stop:1786 length:174 start_codon:yes stop_codon:yes gene_type:complete
MTEQSLKVVNQLDLLIDLNSTLDSSYQEAILRQIKADFYEALKSELQKQHQTYLNLI